MSGPYYSEYDYDNERHGGYPPEERHQWWKDLLVILPFMVAGVIIDSIHEGFSIKSLFLGMIIGGALLMGIGLLIGFSYLSYRSFPHIREILKNDIKQRWLRVVVSFAALIIVYLFFNFLTDIRTYTIEYSSCYHLDEDCPAIKTAWHEYDHGSDDIELYTVNLINAQIRFDFHQWHFEKHYHRCSHCGNIKKEVQYRIGSIGLYLLLVFIPIIIFLIQESKKQRNN